MCSLLFMYNAFAINSIDTQTEIKGMQEMEGKRKTEKRHQQHEQ